MKKLLFAFMLLCFSFVSAQSNKTVPIKVSGITQKIDGKEYYVHIVEQGQTVFSISRAYGLKYYDAVLKTDIHFMKIGDTVWLPMNQYSVAAVTEAANKIIAPENRVHYIKVDAGQTLYGISREYGVTIDQIIEANPELKTQQLKAGQMLKIPAPDKEALEKDTMDVPAQPEPKKEITAVFPARKTDTVASVPPQEPVKPTEPKKPSNPVAQIVQTPPATPEPEPKKETVAVTPVPKEDTVATVVAVVPTPEPVKPAEPIKPANPVAQTVQTPPATPEPEPKKDTVAVTPEPKKDTVVTVVAVPTPEPVKPAEPIKPANPVAQTVQTPPATPEPEPKKDTVVTVVAVPTPEPVKPAEPIKPANPVAQTVQTPPATPEPEPKKDTVAVEPEPSKTPVAKPEPPAAAAIQQPTPVVGNAENTLDTATVATPRPIVNPYPFTEVPEDFPTTQSPYYNFSTLSTFNYQVRERQSTEKIYVTVMMPLNLDKIGEISTSKFDIEQRGKKEYKVFEFVQFYEGLLMALEQLQKKGCNVVLNVVDVTSENDDDIVALFNSHNVANSDFIIALLVKKPFEKVAELARQHQVFVINPFSSRVETVKDNPYVIKYMPSVEGTVKAMLDVVAAKYKDSHLYVIHSGSRTSRTGESEYLAELQKQLDARGNIKYTVFDWTANAKLINALKTTKNNVIISIYNVDKNKNSAFANTLLTRLYTLKTNVPVLLTNSDFLKDLNIDKFEEMQHVNYAPVTIGYLDYENPRHKNFIETYKAKFRTEPNSLYAGVAYDLMYYFVMALTQNGAEFWRNPQNFATPAELLFPFSLKQQSPTSGYENQSAEIYQMNNYRLKPVVSR